MDKEFWIVGKNTNYEESAWEFQGLYDDEMVAAQRCETEDFWIAKVILNEFIPTEKSEFIEAYYPLLK